MSTSARSPVIHGIRNCDTMRKAMAWLDANGIEYRFHDYRKDGLDADRLRAWAAAAPPGGDWTPRSATGSTRNRQ